MMNGIEVLNQVTLYHAAGICNWWPAFLLVFIAGMLTTFITWEEDNTIGFLSGLVLCIGGVVLTVMCGTQSILDKSNPYQQYQVTISDSVNYNEFTSKYNVVKQDGRIYTIIEKTNNK